MKNWWLKTWSKIRAWFIGVLAFLGLVAAPVLVAIPTSFTYTPPTTYEDGSPLPIEQIGETRLYCNGSLVASEPGSDGDFNNVDLPPGNYNCYATVIATNGQESQPSNVVVRNILTDSAPNPPTLDP